MPPQHHVAIDGSGCRHEQNQFPRSSAAAVINKQNKLLSLASCCHSVTGDPKAFDDWAAVHDSHDGAGLMLAAMSIWMDNDTILNERTIIQFTHGCFIADFADTSEQNQKT